MPNKDFETFSSALNKANKDVNAGRAVNLSELMGLAQKSRDSNK